MSYIKGANTCAKQPMDCCVEKEPEHLVTLESATFKIKSTGTEVVIGWEDIKDKSGNWSWKELASSSAVTEIIINELSKNI